MKTSQSGIDLIKKFEGFRSKPYLDIVGVKTIGYGHACFNGEVPPDCISLSQADELLKSDLAKFESGVNALVKIPLIQNQFDALVSFAFNLGLGNLKSSTLLKKLNAKDISGAADEFHKWDLAGGKHVKGLLIRRMAEKELFERLS